MEGFWENIRIGTSMVWQFFCYAPLWIGLGKLVLFFVVDLGIAAAFWWIRKTLREKCKNVWPSRIFSLVRWIILTPAWWLISIGVLYALEGELGWAILLASVLVALYVVMAMGYARNEEW